MKYVLMRALLCAQVSGNIVAMAQQRVQPLGNSQNKLRMGTALLVAATAYLGYKYYQMHLETKRLKDEEEKKLQEMQENLNRAAFEEKLRVACIDGSAEKAQEALEGRASCNKRFSDEITPLMLASMYGYHLIVQKLLRYDADCLLKDVHGKSAYDYALENEQHEVLRLLKNAATNILKEEAWRSAINDIARVREAIAAGANVNAISATSHLPLIQVALLNFNQELIAELICQGAEYPQNILEDVTNKMGVDRAQCVKDAILERKNKWVRARADAQLKEKIKNNGQSLQLT